MNLKQIVLPLLTFSTLNAFTTDTTQMRIAVFSTLATYTFVYMQDQNELMIPLKYRLKNTQITLIKGKEMGQEDRALNNTQFSLVLPWKHNLYSNNNFILTGNTEFGVNRYSSDLTTSLNSVGYIYSIIPMFTYTFNNLKILQMLPYLKIGIGFALLDNTMVENREKSTQFQFNDNIGIGLTYKSYSFGYRFTHISNLGLKMPNPGLDFHQIEFNYSF